MKSHITTCLAEYEDLLRDLGGRGSRPSPELYVLEKELGKARAELKQATAIFQHQKQQLETRLAAEVSGGGAWGRGLGAGSGRT